MKTFLKKFIKSPKTVGSFVPSSHKLISSMLKNIDFLEDLLIVEFGAGTGVITKQILKKISPNSKILVFEIHSEFIDELNKIKDPRVKIIHDGAQNITNYLNGEKADVIISGLPFGSLPKKLGKSILDESHKNLKLNGKFVQFQYFLQNKKDIFNTFKNHKISLQLLNFPPAFIYKCEKLHD
ncbi:methyltransferase [Candidatus Gracilibacteria bacterium]|nr:methyltransferase [Candidatus Gracilibacteria bacterium]